MLKLVSVTPNGHKMEYPLTEGISISVGRSPECDLPIAHGGVSKKHIIVTCTNGRVFIENPPGVTPTNGTKIRGMRLQNDEKIEVFDGDVILCGAAPLYIMDSDADSQATIDALKAASNDMRPAANPMNLQPTPFINQQPLVYGPPSSCQPPTPVIQPVPVNSTKQQAPAPVPQPAPVNTANSREMAPIYGPPLNQQPPIPPKPIPQTTISSVNAVGYGPPSFWDRGLLDKVKVRSLTCPALSPGFITPDEIKANPGMAGQFQRQQGVVQASAPDVNPAPVITAPPESERKIAQTFAEQNNSANAPDSEKTDNSEDNLNK